MSTAIAKIDYPSSDGKPMAETPYHMRVMIDLIETLRAWFAFDKMIYIWGNMFIYFVPGNIRKNVSPDVFLVKGVDRDKPRDVYKVWEEKGLDLAIEVTSRKTKKEDQEKKFLLYQDVLAVPEYFLFDPKGDYLKPPLKGYRLIDGLYQPIAPENGRLPSEVLGLHLERDGRELRLFDPIQGRRLLTPQEEIDRLRRELDSLRKKQGNP